MITNKILQKISAWIDYFFTRWNEKQDETKHWGETIFPQYVLFFFVSNKTTRKIFSSNFFDIKYNKKENFRKM